MSDKYRKALKNYTTRSPISNIVADIQQILIDFGATNIAFTYDQGRISAINFGILIDGNTQIVSVPLFADKVQEVLRQQGVFGKRRQAYNNMKPTTAELEQSYRTALATVRDWLDSQLAYMTTKQVEFAQLFLPYMQAGNGKTVYDLVKDRNFVLTSS